MPWFLYLALKHLFPTGRGVTFFTIMSAIGVAVGVALLIVVTSIMGGFGLQIRQMIVDTQGEIQVLPFGPGAVIDDAPALLAQIEQNPRVAAATPSAQGVVMLMHRNMPAFPAIQGVDLARIGRVMPLDRYLVEGRLDDLDDDSILLSIDLARALRVRAGAEVDVFSPLLLRSFGQSEVVLPRTVRIAGIFQVGHPHLDKSTVITTLRLMQDLYGLGKTVHGINVRLKPGADEFAVAAELNATLPGTRRALTWFESNADFQSIIRFEKNMIFLLLTTIIVVAALSIMSSLLISVVRKTREIGLLSALGGKPWHIAACFCAQGFFLGVTGTIFGLLLAWIVLTNRESIVTVLARLTSRREVFEQFYGFVHLPSHTSGFDLTVTIGGTLVAATLAGLLPAWRAAKLNPVEALRSE